MLSFLSNWLICVGAGKAVPAVNFIEDEDLLILRIYMSGL